MSSTTAPARPRRTPARIVTLSTRQDLVMALRRQAGLRDRTVVLDLPWIDPAERRSRAERMTRLLGRGEGGWFAVTVEQPGRPVLAIRLCLAALSPVGRGGCVG